MSGKPKPKPPPQKRRRTPSSGKPFRSPKIAPIEPSSEGDGQVAKELSLGMTHEERWALINAQQQHATEQRASGAAFPWTEDELGDRFAREFHEVLKFVPVWNQWVGWDGTCWVLGEPKDDAIPQRFGTKLLGVLNVEAFDIEDENRQKQALQFWKHASSRNGKSAMIKLAKSRAIMVGKPDWFDADPWSLGVKNGTVHLKTGKLRPGQQEDFITKSAGCSYDPNATCPSWEQFIDWAFCSDQELIHYVQKLCGYVLTGEVTEQTLHFLYGGGSNGKSTFVEVILALYGGYGQKTKSQLFTKNGLHGEKETLIARLHHARFVVGAEIPAAVTLDETMVKDLSGSDTLTARKLYGSHFNFLPTHKLFGYGNHRPAIHGTDWGIWRRVALIPFNAQVSEAEKDRGLPAKLKAELPGILNWMIQGCLAWQQDGLTMPQAVTVATDDYREAEDEVGEFIDECCQPTGEITRKELYSAYYDWRTEYRTQPGRYVLAPRLFAERLRRPDINERKSHGTNIWTGISLKMVADAGGEVH